MAIKSKIENLESREQTAASIYESAQYFNDLNEWLDTPLRQFFNYVKRIPYQEDPEPLEIVGRPKYLLFDRKRFPGLDCKKKAVLMGAWLEAHSIPWRLLAISERPDKQIHHVFVQAKIGGDWQNIDATLPDYNLYDPKPAITAGEILWRN